MHWQSYDWAEEERQTAEFHLANGIGEELHGKWVHCCATTTVIGDIHLDAVKEVFQITRHQANLNTEEVHKWIEEMTKARVSRHIWIDEPTIG